MKEMKDVALGVWVDDPKNRVLTQLYFDIVHRLKIGTLAVMIDPMSRAWDSMWTEKDIVKLLEFADKDCIEIVLTVWPYPDKEQLQKMFKSLIKFLSIGGISGLEFDIEFNWNKRYVSGYRNLREASNYLVGWQKEICRTYDVRSELTTFTNHVENGPNAILAPQVDRLNVQAYSVQYRNKRYITWNHRYGPGHMQILTLDKTYQVPGVVLGKPQVCCGLAAWQQHWHGHTTDEAMMKALDTALTYRPVEIRYFSSKHIFGVRQKQYAFSFVNSLR